MATRQEILKTRFWAAASHRIASANMTIAVGCEQHLRDFIEVGVSKISDPSTSEVAITQAEANLVAFVAKMIVDAAADGDSELHENRFFAAKTSLCPVWPFC